VGRLPYYLLALLTAILAAFFVATIAHYDMGMRGEAIRTDTLSVAGFLSAAVIVVALFKRG
jgi:hypothetical protein